MTKNKMYINQILNEALGDYYDYKNGVLKGTVCIFYTTDEYTGVKYFEDYEPTINSREEYLKLLEDEEIDEYNKALESQDFPGKNVYNIVYNDEKIDIVSYDELVWILVYLNYSQYSLENKVIMYYMLINDVSSYKLAKLLNISKQAVSDFFNGKRDWPQARLEQIADIFKFDKLEYFNKTCEYVLK